jgi:epoxyqueuosine reductase
MDYMRRQAPRRREPERIVAGATRAVVALKSYFQDDRLAERPQARVARYAWGEDYHRVVGDTLARLAGEIVAMGGDPKRTRWYVDAGPVPERELAQRAGLGWIAKNTMLIHPRLGSFTFIGVVFTDLALEVDPPFEADHCGSCRLCLDACPTDAFPAERVLDARRCISYLTIELQGSIPEEFRPLIGNRVYGCDDCQDACPWNSFAQASAEPDFAVRNGLERASLVDLFAWSEQEFDERMAGSPIRRIGYERWLRNLAVGLGNAPATPEVKAALRARADHPSALVREHVSWALSRHD